MRGSPGGKPVHRLHEHDHHHQLLKPPVIPSAGAFPGVFFLRQFLFELLLHPLVIGIRALEEELAGESRKLKRMKKPRKYIPGLFRTCGWPDLNRHGIATEGF